MRKNGPSILKTAIIAAVLCFILHSATADTWYVENEWNYMDVAMNADNGIPEDAEGNLARIQRNGVLKVAMDFETPPMSFRDLSAEGNNQYAGMDMELARMIAKKMGVKLVIIPMPSDHKLLALMEDQCDLTISAVAYTPGRSQFYTLSRAYYIPEEEADIGILTREDKPVASLEELDNKVIAAQSNSLQETFAAANVTGYREFRRTSSALSVYNLVEDGTADAGIVSIRVANLYFLNNPEYHLCLAEELRFYPETQYRGYRVAAKKGETQLIAFVNGVINEAEETGMLEKWLTEATRQAETLGLTGK